MRRKHKQAHTAVPRGKRVRVVLKDGTEFVDKFIDRRPHDVVFETRSEKIADIQSMTIYRMPPHLLRHCGDKVDYKSEETARKSAEAMQRKTGDKYDAYNCEVNSSHWHIGHSRQEVKIEFDHVPTPAELSDALKRAGLDPKQLLPTIKAAIRKAHRE